MKKLLSILLLLMMCAAVSALAADGVPRSVSELPPSPGCPDAPQIVRVQRGDAEIAVTLDRDLPAECLVTIQGVDGNCRVADRSAAPRGNRAWQASGLPSGGSWTGIEIAWVSGNVNALAHYSIAGSLAYVIAYDASFNEFVYDEDGVLMEFGYANGGVRVRFDGSGSMERYAYRALANTLVWFNRRGEAVAATYDDGVMRAEWETGVGWFVSVPDGLIGVTLDVNPESAAPLLPPEDEEEEDKPVWYPNNTIGLAGLSLQEASTRLPDKWYNVVPVNLTAEGRQTYFLVITNNKFIGKCYVDVYGDTVTVTYDLIHNSSIEFKSHYGRWFTSLSQITAQSIEANDKAIPFGEPVSISQELDGARVALLFIRSKATYCLPFRDGSALTEYWRNKPEWKEFRQNLTTLMQYVNK